MNVPSLQRQAISRLAGPGVSMLVASMFLGLLYNSASPLGVRWSNSGGARASTTPPSSAPASLGNETISMSLLSPSTPPASGKAYQNETISVSLTSPQAAGAMAKPAGNPPGAFPTGTAPAPRRIIPSVTWREVKPLLADNQIVLVDARVAAQYQAGHIPGALLLTAHGPLNELSAFAQKYSRTTPLIIYCGTEKCPMSHDLAEALISQYGYTNVKVMPGGYAEYRLAESQSTSAAAVK